MAVRTPRPARPAQRKRAGGGTSEARLRAWLDWAGGAIQAERFAENRRARVRQAKRADVRTDLAWFEIDPPQWIAARRHIRRALSAEARSAPIDARLIFAEAAGFRSAASRAEIEKARGVLCAHYRRRGGGADPVERVLTTIALDEAVALAKSARPPEALWVDALVRHFVDALGNGPPGDNRRRAARPRPQHSPEVARHLAEARQRHAQDSTLPADKIAAAIAADCSADGRRCTVRAVESAMDRYRNEWR